MLSGNGRHRRPRQAPALVVAAGVTGSAIAIPLLGATGASAASGTTWDAVAQCESGGSWSADEGNGYYGGLQVTQETWETYGGLDYAPSADQASRSQQIAVAERVLAAEGPDAWPTCGLGAGLAIDPAPADVDTGVAEDATASSSGAAGGTDRTGAAATESADGADGAKDEKSGADGRSADSTKSDASGSTGSSDGTTGSASGDDVSSEDGDSADDSGKTEDPSTSTESDESGKTAQNQEASVVDTESAGGGRHRGASAEEDAADSRADTASTGRHASREDGASLAAQDGSYVVQSGDSLCGIADSLGVEGGWSQLYATNKETVGADPDLILPGQSLEVAAE